MSTKLLVGSILTAVVGCTPVAYKLITSSASNSKVTTTSSESSPKQSCDGTSGGSSSSSGYDAWPII